MARHESEHEKEEHEGRARGGGMHTTMEMDHLDDKRGGHVRRPRRARGGVPQTKVNEYNAQGSPEEREIEDESEDFGKGGRAKRRHGGKADGEHTQKRADRMPRGRHARGGAVHDGDHHVEHDGHGGHHHAPHHHSVEHEGHGVHHHAAHGHAVHHHGDGDIHVHKRRGGKAKEHEHRARGGSVWSTGANIKMQHGDRASSGIEGQNVPPEPAKRGGHP